MNPITKIGIGIFVFFVGVSMVSQCSQTRSVQQNQASPSSDIILREYAKGLDLGVVTGLAKKAKDAADFERLLNSPVEAVNNMDLNDDSKVDYIKVTEYGSGDQRGFSLTTELSPGETQEIATIEFQRDHDNATVQTTGNPSLYGAGNYHHSSFGLTDALLLGWLFSNRPSYASPYGYGNYPPSYGGGWSKQATDSYSGAMKSRTAGSTVKSSSQPVFSSSAASPNAAKTAAKARAISSPSVSQRSFSSSPSRPSSSRPTPSGGFGRSSSSGSSRSGGFSRGGK